MFDLLRAAWEEEKICANDIANIFLHFLGQDDETKVFFLFSLFDMSDEGKLTCAQLKEVLLDSMKENGVIFDEGEIRQLVSVLIEECLGREVKGCPKGITIEYADIRRLLDQEKGLAAALAAR